MKRFFLLLTVLGLVSCNLDENITGFIQDNDEKSDIVVKLADSYLAGNFDIARDYFTPDGKHYFNNLEFDVDGIIDGYNSHSLIFEEIKHNDRKVYTGTFTKSNGQKRTMNFIRPSDAPSGTFPSSMRQRSLRPGFETVWDIDAGGYRTFNSNTQVGSLSSSTRSVSINLF